MDCKKEVESRVAFIKEAIKNAGAKGIIFGNSGGKDSALVGILCKLACDNVLGVIMPCESKRNYEEDKQDGLEVAKQFNIETITVDITSTKAELVKAISCHEELSHQALTNIAPRLRMATLYAIGQSLGYLVAGTGNRSEIYMGYFTKWGDGAYDLNPIADLTVTEIYELLDYLNAPLSIRTKAPSAGLYEGQTDEQEMGVSYASIDEYLLKGTTDPAALEIIKKAHDKTEHKRKSALIYSRS